MSIRRVSFSDRISYSDEASTTTVSTDDELFRDDDGSFVTSEDEDEESDVEEGSFKTEVIIARKTVNTGHRDQMDLMALYRTREEDKGICNSMNCINFAALLLSSFLSP